ncbi:MAG TPA: c-type cytochrome [Bryobacteraceae bacterium]|nr:c-type cytochrome [Bryobacteraceae bacterium]
MFRVMLFLLAATLSAEELHNPRTTPADVAAGAKSFHSHCAPCHGYTAEGGRGPNLTTGHFFHGSTDADLFNNITNGIPGTEMPSIFFSPDRVWQIVAYIRSLNGTSATPRGDKAAGLVLFRSKGCMQCHSVKGQGGELGPDLTGIGASRSVKNLRESIVDPNAQVPPQYWIVSFEDQSGSYVKGFLLNEDTYTVQLLDMRGNLRSYDKAKVSGYKVDKHSAMPSYRSSLTGDQLNDLVAYLWSLRPE